MNKESTISILTNLLQRHEDAARKYREAAAMTEARGLKNFLANLADYREGLYRENRQWLEDMPPSPAPISVSARSYFHKNWESLREALMLEKQAKIAEACRRSEEQISEYYREALSQKGIPLPLHNNLEAQHQKVISILRKAERMEKVPAQRHRPL